MAKVKLSPWNFAVATFRAHEEVAKPATMRRLAEMAVEMVRLRTRLGYGVAKDGDARQKLEPLKDATKKARARNPDLSGDTRPGRSNLTETGQLLDSVKVLTAEQGRATFGPSGLRKDEKLSNDKLAAYVTQQGRPFTHLSGTERKRINDEIKRLARAAIKKVLGK